MAGADTKNRNYAIIVAGGSGTRMQTAVPKQFMLLNRTPVLMHTIDAFASSNSKPEIIVVLPAEYHTYWGTLCTEHNFNTRHQLATGGDTRFHSVKNGLGLINDKDAIVAVHDAVRPLISAAIIDRSYMQAQELGNAITAIKSRDSVRLVENGKSKSVLRSNVYLVQTPQTFQLAQLKKAYLQAAHENFTDDASVVESAGFTIHILEGGQQNTKITYSEDIAIAELFLKNKKG